MLPNVGWAELFGIMLLALVVFGPNRLPDIARQIGRAVREVRKIAGQFEDEIRANLPLDELGEDFPYMKGPRKRRAQLPADTTGHDAAPVQSPTPAPAEDQSP